MRKYGRMIAVAGAALALAASASAQVDMVTLRFDGLACPFCVYNVEKQIKKIEGVDRDEPIANDLKRGLIWFGWDPERAFEPEEVREAAGHSGFTLRRMRVSAAGRVGRPSDDLPAGMALMEPESHRSVRLAPGERADRREAWEALRAYAAGSPEPAGVRVEGAVEGEGSAWRLVLHAWSPLEYGAVVDAEVEGFVCERCATGTMRALREIDGVIHAQASHETGRVLVWTAGTDPDTAPIRRAIERIGFTVSHVHTHGRRPEQHHPHDHPHDHDHEDGG